MGVRTGVSEDPKGDPSKVLPDQPIPDRRSREGIEPLLPRQASPASAPPAKPQAQTPADRRGLKQQRRGKK